MKIIPLIFACLYFIQCSQAAQTWCVSYGGDSHSCLNGGECLKQLSQPGCASDTGYACSCAGGYGGTYCDTMINECNTDPCPSDATCTDGVYTRTCTCPTNKFYIQNYCRSCDAGYYLPTGDTCQVCPIGKYRAISSSPISCTSCPAGKYNPATGGTSSSACISCPAGYYTNLAGDNKCYPCQRDYYAGSTGFSVCTVCSAGQFSSYGATTCAGGCRANLTAPFLWATSGSITGRLYQISPTTGEELGYSIDMIMLGDSTQRIAAASISQFPYSEVMWAYTSAYSATYPRSVVKFLNPYDGQATLVKASLSEALQSISWVPDGSKLHGWKSPFGLGASGLYIVATSSGVFNQYVGGTTGSVSVGSITYTPVVSSMKSVPSRFWRNRSFLGTPNQPKITRGLNASGGTDVSYGAYPFPVTLANTAFAESTPSPNQETIILAVSFNDTVVELWWGNQIIRNYTMIHRIANFTSSIALTSFPKTSAESACPASCSSSKQCTLPPKLHCNATSSRGFCVACPPGKTGINLRTCV